MPCESSPDSGTGVPSATVMGEYVFGFNVIGPAMSASIDVGESGVENTGSLVLPQPSHNWNRTRRLW